VRSLPRSLRRLPVVRDWIAAFESMAAERDRALAARDAAAGARGAALADRDAARMQRDAAVAEHAAALAERDAAAEAEQAMRADRDAARAERATAVNERNAVFAERTAAVDQRDGAVAAREAALAERDAAANEREAAVAERDAAVARRDAAVTERDAASAERDAALAQREAAASAAAALRAEIDAMRPELDALRPRTEPQVAAAIRDRLPRAAKARGKAGRNALIVPVRGPVADREIALTQPFFADYCRRIGAELRIVEVPDSVPDLLVRASLLPVARDYRRFAIIDSGVLIRRGCPDLFSLVPEDAVGAVREGQFADRSRVCVELADMYGFAAPPPAKHYIDTGVLVLSRGHLPLLERLLQSPVARHPRDEQGFINAVLHRDRVPRYALPREFNWIPYTPEEFDWRWAWAFQIGDYWRSPPREPAASRRSRDRRGPREAPLPLEPRHCRLPYLIEAAAELRGATIRVVHPGEMGYHPPAGRIIVTDDDAAVIWCDAATRGGSAGVLESPPIYGPYARLGEGRWEVSLVGPDGQSPADGDIVVDMAYDVGCVTVRRPEPIGPEARFEIVLDRDVEDMEVRIYRGEREFAVGAIVFRRLPDNAGAAAPGALTGRPAGF
jgi:hypothetical protein